MKEKRGHRMFAVLEYAVEFEDTDQTEHLGKRRQELQKPFRRDQISNEKMRLMIPLPNGAIQL